LLIKSAIFAICYHFSRFLQVKFAIFGGSKLQYSKVPRGGLLGASEAKAFGELGEGAKRGEVSSVDGLGVGQVAKKTISISISIYIYMYISISISKYLSSYKNQLAS
jgi:hypothetical protein